MERASSDAVAWIELHQTLPQSGKLIRLKRELRIRTPQAIGHLCLLWLWALDNAQDGDLTRFTAKEIAEVCQYTGRPQEKLLQVLITTGFVDEDLHLHNWYEHVGRLTDARALQRIQARDRQRKRREKLRLAKAADALLECDSHAPTVQYTTEQYTTVPYRKEDSFNEGKFSTFVTGLPFGTAETQEDDR